MRLAKVHKEGMLIVIVAGRLKGEERGQKVKFFPYPKESSQM